MSLGFDITFEKRDSPYWTILGLNLAGLCVGAAATACAVWLDVSTRRRRLALALYDVLLPLSLGQPIAFIVLYNSQ